MTSEPEISAPHDTSQEKSASPILQELAGKLEKLASAEEKIRFCLEFMRGVLGDKAPRFKDYWEAKRICLPLFKESLPPPVRSQLWAQYIEVSTEARHLKEILDEQSAFAMEQIDLAIQAIEADLAKYSEITPSDIQRVARQYLGATQRSVVWTNPKAQAGPAR